MDPNNQPPAPPKLGLPPGAPADPNTADVAVFVQQLLTQMQSRFEQMSTQILNRIDEMGARIDDMEKHIGELMKQTGVEVPPHLVANPTTAAPAQDPPVKNP